MSTCVVTCTVHTHDGGVSHLWEHVCVLAVGLVQQQCQSKELPDSIHVCSIQAAQVDFDACLEEEAVCQGFDKCHPLLWGFCSNVHLGIRVKPEEGARVCVWVWVLQCSLPDTHT